MSKGIRVVHDVLVIGRTVRGTNYCSISHAEPIGKVVETPAGYGNTTCGLGISGIAVCEYPLGTNMTFYEKLANTP